MCGNNGGQCSGHAKKMCAMSCCPCNLDLEKLKAVVKDAKFICKACGRAANDESYLCQPEAIG